MRYKFLDLKQLNEPYMGVINEALRRVAESGRYVGGTEVERFESLLSAHCSTLSCDANTSRNQATQFHAVGVSNGLDALRLILKAWLAMGKLNPGDEVIVAANTYIASVLAIVDAGLRPVLAEPSPVTMNLDTSRLGEYLTERTRAVMPVHLYGRVCWDETLAKFVTDHNLLVIEDNAQAIGAEACCDGLFGSRRSGALGHAGAFSFYPTKNLGALGDAGAVVTPDEELARTVRALSNSGSDRRYHNILIGYNCRLDPIQAAVLNAKIGDLNEVNERRRMLARIYDAEITNPKVKLPLQGGKDNVWHQYVVTVDNRDDFRSYLAAAGVETDIHYAVPPHRQPCMEVIFAGKEFPLTDYLAARVVSLPISACTSESDARAIASIVNKF